MTRSLAVFFAVLLASPLVAADRPDILVADFEGDAYPEGWKTTGTAFGKGPAKGTLPNQMPVSGFLGKGLVNSYLGGDDSTGTLTSPPFKLEREYLNFLVGGGNHKNKTCVNILIDGKVVHTVTGPNDRPGGSEHLDWHTWHIAKHHQGKEAVIEIVDDQKGGWGHINADHFVQSDKKKQAEEMTRAFEIDKPFWYLRLPVKNGAPMRRMTLSVRHNVSPFRQQIRDEVVREFDIELADGVEPDFWVGVEMAPFHGKTLIVKTMLPGDSKALDKLKVDEDVPSLEKPYQEKHRPLFHFTSFRGWLNDPNGLVYVPDLAGFRGRGEWHLFYQHNPYGREWGNMHWGHAVSTDLVRWKEPGIALYPRKYGDWAFSGSAVYDKDNTSGWALPKRELLVLAYTSTGRGECIAFSTDRGKTWTEYDKNPVVKHGGRDPKLIWHAPTKKWVMAVYDEHDKKQWIAFYTSPDLKEWTFASRIEGFFECPDLFPLLVEPAQPNKVPAVTKWVLYAADGKYLLGEFDGKEFKPDFKEKKQLWHGNFYAAQTFDNAPNTTKPPFSLNLTEIPRRVQIGWAQGVTFPGMPFNQQMTVPVELTLREEKDGPRLCARPVSELDTLRDDKPAFELKTSLGVTTPKVLAEDLDAFDVELEFDSRRTGSFALDLRGTKLIIDMDKRVIRCANVTAPLPAAAGRAVLTLRVLVDRGSVEVFADGGRVAMSVAAIPDEKNRKVELVPQGGEVTLNNGRVWRMKSAWEK